MLFNRLLLSSGLLFATGCGYQWHSEYSAAPRPVVVVPYIPGDESGLLTTEIISCLQTSGLAKVSATHGDFRLGLKILGERKDQIGYRRDPQKIKNEIQKNLLAAELRKTIDVEVTLFHGNTEEIAFGPYLISSWYDYDFVDGDSYQDLTFPGPLGVPVEVLPFSLGQLEDLAAAETAASKPLVHKLAQKIVDVISSEW